MANEKRLIDANALIADIAKAQDELITNNDALWQINQKYYKGLAWAHRLALDAPTVDAVEVVHAHWIYDGDEVDGNIQAHCSNCFAGDIHATWKKNEIPYCWNCGAKMDGGNEDV